MVKGKTASGFEFEVNPGKFSDARFLMNYAKIKAGGDKTGNILLIEWVLGADAFEALCKHCEDDDGVAPIDSVLAEFKEIVAEATKDSETKN